MAAGTLGASAALRPAEAQFAGQRGGFVGGVGGGYRPGYSWGYRPGYAWGYRPGYAWGYRPGYAWGYRPWYGYGYRPYGYGYPWWGWAPFGVGLGIALGSAWGSAYYAPPAYVAPYPYVEPYYYPPGAPKPGAAMAVAPPPASSAWPRSGANAGICQAGPVTCGLPTTLVPGQPCSCPSTGGPMWGYAQ